MSNSNFGFLALALRQRLIKRWSLMHSVQPESVLEHSAVVTLLSYLAAILPFSEGSRWIWLSCLLMLRCMMQPRFSVRML